MNRRRIPTYVASPYGFAPSTRSWYYETFLPLIQQYVDVIDPWEEVPDFALETAETWLELGSRHLNNIANRTQLVVAALDQEPPDTGTVLEVGWAAAHRIPVIAYREDLRSSGEPGLRYNLMIGAAVRRSGGIEVGELGELEVAISTYVSRADVAR